MAQQQRSAELTPHVVGSCGAYDGLILRNGKQAWRCCHTHPSHEKAMQCAEEHISLANR